MHDSFVIHVMIINVHLRLDSESLLPFTWGICFHLWFWSAGLSQVCLYEGWEKPQQGLRIPHKRKQNTKDGACGLQCWWCLLDDGWIWRTRQRGLIRVKWLSRRTASESIMRPAPPAGWVHQSHSHSQQAYKLPLMEGRHVGPGFSDFSSRDQ